MKRLLLTVFAILWICLDAHGQADTLRWRFISMEIGTGLAPMHIRVNEGIDHDALAEKGQEVVRGTSWSPNFSISGVFEKSDKKEIAVSLGLCMPSYKILQYQAFGTDPDGKTRYDVNGEASIAGRAHGNLMPVAHFSYRWLYDPTKPVKVYSSIGIGFIPGFLLYSDVPLVPLPEVTPVGFRYCGRHLYGFVETGFGPLFSLARFGLGWKF